MGGQSVTQWSAENQVPFIGESVSNNWMKALKQEKMTNLGSRTGVGKPQLRMIVASGPHLGNSSAFLKQSFQGKNSVTAATAQP